MIANGAADAKRSSDLRVMRPRARLAEFTALGDVLQIARVLGGDQQNEEHHSVQRSAVAAAVDTALSSFRQDISACIAWGRATDAATTVPAPVPVPVPVPVSGPNSASFETLP